jgi:RNA polymerase sigma-70 factor, ECF subfamily
MKDPLAMRIKLGDEQAFELLFRKFNVRLCVFANKFLNDPEEAQEIVQNVFIKIWEGRDDIDPEDSLKSYVFKIVQNLSLNKLRRKKVESRYIEIYKLVYIEQQEHSAHDSLLARELEEHITHSIGKLPCECRKVFELSRVDGLKYREIADTLNISVKTVEAQMSKALRSLRVELSEYLVLFLIALISSNL